MLGTETVATGCLSRKGRFLGRSGKRDSRCGVDGDLVMCREPRWIKGFARHKTLLTTGADTFVGTANNDLITATNTTYTSNDLILDTSSTDNDRLELTTTTNITATPTVAGIETFVVGVSKTGAFTFAADNITGMKTITVNRGDLFDGAISGAGSVEIQNAKSTGTTYVAGEKVTAFTVDFADNSGAATVDARNATGAVTVTDVEKGGLTVLGAEGKAISVSEKAGTTGSVATVLSSGNVTLTSTVDKLTVGGSAAVAYTLANAIADNLTVQGDSAVTIKVDNADKLSGKELTNSATGAVNVEVNTTAGTLDLSDFDLVTSVVLAADFGGSTITTNSEQLITTKTNQTGTVTVDAADGGNARFAVLDNAADAAVTVATLNFTNFESVTIDATADKLTATSGVGLDGADLVLTGTQDINLGAVANAASITSASTGKVTLSSTGNAADSQAISLGAGDDTVTVDSANDEFIVNLGAGANTLTITAAKAESQFVTGAGADTVTIANTNKVVVTTGAGNDRVTVNGNAAHQINLGEGDDILVLNAGADTSTAVINLGSGSNTIRVTDDVDATDVTFSGSVSTVNLTTASKAFTIDSDQFASFGSFSLTGEGDLVIQGVDGQNNVINASVITLAFGTTATVTIESGDGDDVITGTVAADTFDLTAGGTDTIVFTANTGTGNLIDAFTAGALASGGDVLNFAALSLVGTDTFTTAAATTNEKALSAAKVIQITDQAAGDWSDVLSIMNAAIDTTGNVSGTTVILVDNGTNTRAYQYTSDGVNAAIEAAEIKLLGTLNGIDDGAFVAANFIV